MRKIKIKSILAAVAGLFLATSCSSSFLDTDPTDAVSSIIQVLMPISVIGRFSVWMT